MSSGKAVPMLCSMAVVASSSQGTTLRCSNSCRMAKSTAFSAPAPAGDSGPRLARRIVSAMASFPPVSGGPSSTPRHSSSVRSSRFSRRDVAPSLSRATAERWSGASPFSFSIVAEHLLLDLLDLAPTAGSFSHDGFRDALDIP